ncbi:hypothetical protein DCAR_0313367 [Daucus carota subsp. sativus]|uniref:Uncharacterized protein n=1 Tax=Daucus carota subsp. sativus TaxID=79200 RepID=A0A166BZD7_DAUCS|nr:PREDICTED: non-classical arabinogalactan protein 30-like [Daucus carota subsp. sativus]WOG94076.1 hypothetical protein DCAR_0313367 [Daucus carota subsp. sativus]
MAINFKLSFILSLVLLVSALAFSTAAEAEGSKAPKKNINVVVEGMVYCQSCKQIGSWKVSHNNPIYDASVSVFCRGDDNGGVNYYKTFNTNTEGYFYAELKGFKISEDSLDVPINSCYVRVVSSPNVYCNYPTNVDYGFSGLGSPLKYENKTISYKDRYKAVVYAAGPLAFRPVDCSPFAKKP